MEEQEPTKNQESPEIGPIIGILIIGLIIIGGGVYYLFLL